MLHDRPTEPVDDALDLLAGGLDLDPIITHTLPLADLREAFDLAADRARASNVVLDLRD